MKIKVNGALREFSDGITVEELLNRLGLQGRLVVVELNREILPRDRYPSHRLKEDDVIELVHFVGGGC